MKVNLIIGAGQLGSRHLQGLLKASIQQSVYVLDTSADSLAVAKERAGEIEHTVPLFFCNSWQQLPAEFDFVIVATGANVRAVVTEQLLQSYKVKFLVLEKVLFQDIASYHKIGALINKVGVKVWVNHPRRMFLHYQQIAGQVAADEQAIYTASGGNWGLACNGLHFIDLFVSIAKSPVHKIDFNWIDSQLQQSKRPGYIEFTGSIRGELKNGSKFLITAFNGPLLDITVSITTGEKRWVVQEGATRMISFDKQQSFKEEISNAPMQFQSSLTTTLAEVLLKDGNCALPTYEEAVTSHIPFIEQSLIKLKELGGIDTGICPIT